MSEQAETSFIMQLFDAKVLFPTGVQGVVGRSATFESVVESFDAIVQRYSHEDGAEIMRFPPVVTRANFEKSDYLRSFPHLIGSIHTFVGNECDHLNLLRSFDAGEDWSLTLKKTELMLCPSACYPVYPALAGILPDTGRLVDIVSYCFRHEPSPDPARMQLFRQHENVCLGKPENVRAFREKWIDRSLSMFNEMGLEVTLDVANDPFFGRTGKMLATNQRDQHLKFEILHPITSLERPTALGSFNYHQEHFAHLFGIGFADGSSVHSACVGFGLERIALALFKKHGLRLAAWPHAVRRTLDLA
jgi:seryl-tRNA synthetase